MDDEPPVPSINMPVKAEASASYTRSDERFVFDSKVYPLCTNKIEDIGVIKKRKFSIICDGQGKMNIKEVLDPLKKLEKLKKAVDQGLITEEDYKRKKQDILDKRFSMTEKPIDFTTIREDMSVYEIENGQILKTMQIIVDIESGKDKKGKFGNLKFQTVSYIYSPPNMNVEGLELVEASQITEKDEIDNLDFTVKRQIVNIYETNDVVILVNPKVEKITSTNKRDSSGMLLRFTTGIDVNIIPKNPKNKIRFA